MSPLPPFPSHYHLILYNGIKVITVVTVQSALYLPVCHLHSQQFLMPLSWTPPTMYYHILSTVHHGISKILTIPSHLHNYTPVLCLRITPTPHSTSYHNRLISHNKCHLKSIINSSESTLHTAYNDQYQDSVRWHHHCLPLPPMGNHHYFRVTPYEHHCIQLTSLTPRFYPMSPQLLTSAATAKL